MNNNKITQEFDNLITSIQSYKDEIEQMQTNNTKLNEDIQVLEKEKKRVINHSILKHIYLLV